MRSAVALYGVPLARDHVMVAEVRLPLLPGLLSTQQAVQRLPAADVRAVAAALGAQPGAVFDDLATLVFSYAQVEWYRVKGEEPAAKIHDTLSQALERTQTSNAEESPKKAKRVGTRPYCRSLIDQGVTDEQELLRLVLEKFPDAKFKLGDVRGCLRNAGKLAWTSRKKGME